MKKEKYAVRDTMSGAEVVAPDGRHAEFIGTTEAEEAAAALNSGESSECEYYWAEPGVSSAQ